MTEPRQILVAGIVSAFFAIAYVFAAFVFFGKFGASINFYRFDPKSEAAKKPHRFVMRRFGAFPAALTASVHAAILGSVFGNAIVLYCFLGVSAVVLACGLAYFFTNRKFRAALSEERRLERLATERADSAASDAPPDETFSPSESETEKEPNP